MRWLGGVLVLVLLMPAVALAHHRPEHPTPPGQTTTTTVTTSSTTTTTTSIPTTTTTAASTTTTAQDTLIDLTADWVITSDDVRSGFTVEANGFQILIEADVTWDQFEIRNTSRVMWHNACGVANLSNGLVVDGGVSGVLGFYPLHWHLCGDSTRGSIVDNVTVQGGRNHAFVPHGSNGITFLGITSRNTIDEAFWWDLPGSNPGLDPDPRCVTNRRYCTVDNSNDIIVDGALFEETYAADSFGVAGATLGAGSGNVIRNSVVRGPMTGNCAGFGWPEQANLNEGGNVWVFENNRAENLGHGCHGLGVWQNDPNLHVIDGFVGVEAPSQYRNGGINHGAYLNQYEYRNVDVPYLNGHALGWSITDSTVGDATMFRHVLPDGVDITFTRVMFDSFTLNDGDPSPDFAPGVYYLNDTNLTCGDIIYQNPHPDSRVVVDGQEC